MEKFDVKFYEYFDNKRKRNVIKAVTTYGGKYVSAYAYQHPSDESNPELGRKIAKLRLDIKIANKRSASMKRRAGHYAEGIAVYENEVRRMKKEMEKALVISSDRKVEASNFEAELAELLASVK